MSIVMTVAKNMGYSLQSLSVVINPYACPRLMAMEYVVVNNKNYLRVSL